MGFKHKGALQGHGLSLEAAPITMLRRAFVSAYTSSDADGSTGLQKLCLFITTFVGTGGGMQELDVLIRWRSRPGLMHHQFWPDSALKEVRNALQTAQEHVQAARLQEEVGRMERGAHGPVDAMAVEVCD